MLGSNASHSYDPTSGLNGGPPGESLGCPPFNGRWIEPLGTWASKLGLTSIVVGIGWVTCYWIGLMSRLVTSWTIVWN
jgi:hypothetical protein